ncbi:hypothetical protein FOZ60_015599 [Perkinsus olseni]|uniref:Uncharacterized protein n=1 Tax=Perkinsus olseni TaxID=32597 RepID=A0A7J6N5E2_PEROL|nr:hypothetical protein FOZ60_015599 [Perkinsus olseni]
MPKSPRPGARSDDGTKEVSHSAEKARPKRGSFGLALQAASRITEVDITRFGDNSRTENTQKKYKNVHEKYFELNRAAVRRSSAKEGRYAIGGDIRMLAGVTEASDQGIITGMVTGIAALLRVSELLALQVRNVKLVYEGSSGPRAEIYIACSKTDQLWQGATVAVGCCCGDGPDPICPFHRLSGWVGAGSEDSRIFPYERKEFTVRGSDSEYMSLSIS